MTRLQPEDWRTFKAIRLEAVRAEPAAFSSTYAETRMRPDESWRQWLENPRCIVLVALVGARPIGLVGAYRGSEDGDERVGVVFGMYANREHRGQGVGRLLLATLFDTLSAFPEIRVVRLWVREDHVPARRLYETLGLRVVGREAQLDGHSRDELIMERPLVQGAAGQ